MIDTPLGVFSLGDTNPDARDRDYPGIGVPLLIVTKVTKGYLILSSEHLGALAGRGGRGTNGLLEHFNSC